MDGSLNYVERPVTILDWKTTSLRNKDVKLVKEQCQHRKGSEWTWESEEVLQEFYPDLFTAANFEDEV